MGLSQREANGAQGQSKDTEVKKKYKRIAVEEHMGFEDYNNYISFWNSAQGAPGMPGGGAPKGNMPSRGMPGGGMEGSGPPGGAMPGGAMQGGGPMSLSCRTGPRSLPI